MPNPKIPFITDVQTVLFLSNMCDQIGRPTNSPTTKPTRP
jgi:hypothetical protein